MRKHILSAYKDGHKWITYCAVCSLEEGALELYAKLRGYMSDVTIDNSKTLINNEIKIVLVKPQHQEAIKTIDVVPTSEENPLASVKLVKSA